MESDWDKYPLWPDTKENHKKFLKAKEEYLATGSDDAEYEMLTLFQLLHGDLKCARISGKISPDTCEALTQEMRCLE